jgi:hypothetical protein
MALAGIEREATALRERLAQLSPDQWNLAVKLDGYDVNPHWIARHVVHDATHHLGDVANLRGPLTDCVFPKAGGGTATHASCPGPLRRVRDRACLSRHRSPNGPLGLRPG